MFLYSMGTVWSHWLAKLCYLKLFTPFTQCFSTLGLISSWDFCNSFRVLDPPAWMKKIKSGNLHPVFFLLLNEILSSKQITTHLDQLKDSNLYFVICLPFLFCTIKEDPKEVVKFSLDPEELLGYKGRIAKMVRWANTFWLLMSVKVQAPQKN